MATALPHHDGSLTLAELREFASFSAASQRYIRRSLDVAFERSDAIAVWSRDKMEAASIRAQQRIYTGLHHARMVIPDDAGLGDLSAFMAPVLTIAAFDLGQERIDSFGAFRFNRSAKPLRLRRAGRRANRAFSPNGWRKFLQAMRETRPLPSSADMRHSSPAD